MQLRLKETHFYCEGGQALKLGSQRGCEVSILKDIEKNPGYGPEQSALAYPANLNYPEIL